MSSLQDRYGDKDEDKTSFKDFFKALGSSTKASGMGHRVYNAADKGSKSRWDGEERPDNSPFQHQLGERRQYDAKPAPPQVPANINSPADVQRALGSQQAFDPYYADAVLTSYVRNQLMMSRDEREVAAELDDLERRLPNYAQAGVFHNVRESFKLAGHPPPAYRS